MNPPKFLIIALSIIMATLVAVVGLTGWIEVETQRAKSNNCGVSMGTPEVRSWPSVALRGFQGVPSGAGE